MSNNTILHPKPKKQRIKMRLSVLNIRVKYVLGTILVMLKLIWQLGDNFIRNIMRFYAQIITNSRENMTECLLTRYQCVRVEKDCYNFIINLNYKGGIFEETSWKKAVKNLSCLAMFIKIKKVTYAIFSVD